MVPVGPTVHFSSSKPFFGRRFSAVAAGRKATYWGNCQGPGGHGKEEGGTSPVTVQEGTEGEGLQGGMGVAVASAVYGG